jgi:quinol monooxygenase YgiN
MGRFVIVAYKPKPQKADRLFAVVKKHIAVLRSENLVSEKAAYVMRAADGTLVEVFEWRDPAAIEAAHKSEAVSALWGEFGEACDFVPLTSLPEAQQMFAEFDAVAL